MELQNWIQIAKNTAAVRLFGFWKIPLLWHLKPLVLELNDNSCVVELPLNRRSKNHIGSMYFAALCAGADLAGGLVAMQCIRNSGKKVHLSFKDFKAEFHKRAEGNCVFSNHEGAKVAEFVQQVIKSGERMNLPVNVEARVPSKLGDEVVANFTLTLSLKYKG